MSILNISKGGPLTGSPVLQGDSQFSSHAVLLSMLSNKPSQVENTPVAPCFSALLNTCRQYFNLVKTENNTVFFQGEWKSPGEPLPIISPLNEENLFSWGGFLAGCGQSARFDMDDNIFSKSTAQLFTSLFHCDAPQNEHPPGIRIQMAPNPPGEIKTDDAWKNHLIKLAILYWGLSKQQEATFKWLEWGADYPEKLLPAFGAQIQIQQTSIINMDEIERRLARKKKHRQYSPQILHIPEGAELQGGMVRAPGDSIQAAVFALAATLQPGSNILLSNISLNPRRTGFFNALKRMGAQIDTIARRNVSGEPCGDIQVKYAELKGRKFDRDSLKGMTLEIPLLAVAGTFAEGETLIRDVGFLRQYREDQLKHLVRSMREIGVQVGEIEDGFIIRGKREYDGSDTHSCGHPLIGLAFLILGLKSHGASRLHSPECMETYFPDLARNLLDMSSGANRNP